MTWAIVNIFAGMTVACLVSYLLGAHGDRFNIIERIGLGLMGGGSVLTIGPILTHAVIIGISPYDDWSGTLLRIGCAIVLLGVMGRLEGFTPSAKLSSQARNEK